MTLLSSCCGPQPCINGMGLSYKGPGEHVRPLCSATCGQATFLAYLSLDAKVQFSCWTFQPPELKDIDFFLCNKESSLKHFVIVAQIGKRDAWHVSLALVCALQCGDMVSSMTSYENSLEMWVWVSLSCLKQETVSLCVRAHTHV